MYIYKGIYVYIYVSQLRQYRCKVQAVGLSYDGHEFRNGSTYLSTSSRLRFEALILRTGTAAASSRKLGE